MLLGNQHSLHGLQSRFVDRSLCPLMLEQKKDLSKAALLGSMWPERRCHCVWCSYQERCHGASRSPVTKPPVSLTSQSVTRLEEGPGGKRPVRSTVSQRDWTLFCLGLAAMPCQSRWVCSPAQVGWNRLQATREPSGPGLCSEQPVGRLRKPRSRGSRRERRKNLGIRFSLFAKGLTFKCWSCFRGTWLA